jgi:NAD(P)-dependent dehydrogenase (short-subunit alcohol dehydrogenase family)
MSISVNYEGKVAVVTGAAKGIGKATAKAFIEAGAKVVITDVLSEVEDVAADMRKSGGEAEALAADISKSESCKELVNLAISRFGRLDYAFNNAGVSHPPQLTHEISEELWNHVLSINLTGVFNCIRYQIPAMLQGGGGVIVNNSSVCGERAFVGFIPYNAAKHGVIGITRTIAVEYGGQGIRCVAVGPGYIETSMTERSRGGVYDENDKAAFLPRIPLGRFGQPEDVAKTVRMLCSDEACYVNGAYIPVDGGLLQT